MSDPRSSANTSTSSILGEVRLFAGWQAPAHWEFCQGQMLKIKEYPELFLTLGTTYGGDGQTTFTLPDLSGRVPIGSDNKTTYLGERGGSNSIDLHKRVAVMGASVNTNRDENNPARIEYVLSLQEPIRSMPPYTALNFIICVEADYSTGPDEIQGGKQTSKPQTSKVSDLLKELELNEKLAEIQSIKYELEKLSNIIELKTSLRLMKIQFRWQHEQINKDSRRILEIMRKGDTYVSRFFAAELQMPLEVVEGYLEELCANNYVTSFVEIGAYYCISPKGLDYLDDMKFMKKASPLSRGEYRVVINALGKWEIIPGDNEVPEGWQVEGKIGSKQECVEYIRRFGQDKDELQRSAFIVHTCVSAPPRQLRR